MYMKLKKSQHMHFCEENVEMLKLSVKLLVYIHACVFLNFSTTTWLWYISFIIYYNYLLYYIYLEMSKLESNPDIRAL